MIQYFKKQIQHFEWHFVALFFIILPLIYSTKLLDPVLYSRYYALSAFLILISLGTVALYFLKRFKFRLDKKDRWVFGFAALYVVWNFLSITVAVNINEAIFQSLKEGVLMVSFFYFYQLLRNNPNGREIIIKSILLMSAIFIGVAFVQLYKADFTTFFEKTDHKGYYLNQALMGVYSTFAGKNLFAIGMVLILPFSIYSFIFYNKFWKGFSVLTFLSAMFFIFILSSKSAWFYLALFFGLLYLLYVIYILKIKPNEEDLEVGIKVKIGLFILPVLIVFAGFFLIAKSDVPVFSFVKDKVLQVFSPEYCEQSIYSSDHPTSAQTRNLVWAQSLQMAKDNPLLGVGAGNWRIHQPSYGLNAYENDIRQGEKLFQRPHNDYLWIAAENGFIGVIAYLLLFISILVLAYRNFYRNKDSKVRVFNALAFSILTGFAVVMMFSFPRERVAINMVYLMLFAIVLSDTPFKDKREECDLPMTVNMIIFISILGLLSFNLYVTRDIYKGEKAARFVQIGVVKENWTLILRASASTEGSFYTLDPYNVPMQYWKGTALTMLDQKERAVNAFQNAYDLCPYNLRPLNNLGATYDLLGQRDTAIYYFEQALSISPRYKDALVNMAIVTTDFENIQKNYDHLNGSDLKKIDEAFTYLKRVENKNGVPSKFEQAYLQLGKIEAYILQRQLDRDKLLLWIGDDNKIKSTFNRFQKGNQEFHQILLAELGKN